jgi:exodeoxyribonuclease V alpha subunit
MVTLQGEVTKVLFCNRENGYLVARLVARDHPGEVTFTGNLGPVSPGEMLSLSGEWVTHPTFGRQLAVTGFEQVMPATAAGVIRFLASGQIKGIGEGLAGRMVEKFGPEVLEIMEKEPEKLLAVRGVGKKLLASIKESWADRREIRGLMLFLQNYDVPLTYAGRIFQLYGLGAVAKLKENPYELARTVRGIGFRTADEMALRLGFDRECPERMEAGILHALAVESDNGHMFVPRDLLLDRAAGLLGPSDRQLLEQGLNRLEERKQVMIEPLPEQEIDEAVYLASLYKTERTIASRVQAICLHTSVIAGDKLRKALDRTEAAAGISLSDEQRQAVWDTCENKVSIITGGPGTGKTTITKVVVRALKELGFRVKLAAPTGRAAKRLAEATGFSASTIHRLLKYNPDGGFEHCEEKKLKADVLVVDEASMLDCWLFVSLLKALSPACRLILIGDEHQLASVGVGNVLGDLLHSGVVPVSRLTRIYRQARESMIVINAHRINEGRMVIASPKAPPEADFFWVENEDIDRVQQLILTMVCERIPRTYGFDPMQDVQVLTPMHKGEVGTVVLNRLLQERLNPGGTSLTRGQRVLRTRDRVIQIRNNYEKEIFNGDLGRITAVDPKEGEVVVDFEGREITYASGDLDELHLAYAMSVHKSQGSEYPAVVMPLMPQHYMLLQRNLIYTGLTRARKLAIMIGSRRALTMGIANAKSRHRFTDLRYRLAQAFSEE